MRRHLWIVFPLLAGIVSGKLFGRWARHSGVFSFPADPLVLLASLPLAILFVLFWHEAGHLLGGRLAGFTPRLLGVGPVLFRWRHGRLGIELNRAWELWGGFASALPPNDARWSLSQVQRGLLFFVAGGPAASLLLAGLAALGGAMLPPAFASVAWVTAFFSAGITLVTLQPWGAGAGLVSDGGRLLTLRRGGVEVDRWSALMLLAGLNLDQVRPRDWPTELIHVAALPGGGLTDRAAGLLLQLEQAWDSGDKAAAAAALDQLRAQRPQLSGLLAQAVDDTCRLWEAHHRQDAEAFETTLQRIGKSRLAASTGSYHFYRELTPR